MYITIITSNISAINIYITAVLNLFPCPSLNDIVKNVFSTRKYTSEIYPVNKLVQLEGRLIHRTSFIREISVLSPCSQGMDIPLVKKP